MLTVGIGEYAMTDDPNEVLVTHSLGSCVAFIAYSPVTKLTALAHVVLPKMERREQIQYLEEKPAYFGDIIVPRIVEYFLADNYGSKENLQFYLAGGAEALNTGDIFRVGVRNRNAILEILDEYQIRPRGQDTGGNVSRTVSIGAKCGVVTVNCHSMIL